MGTEIQVGPTGERLDGKRPASRGGQEVAWPEPTAAQLPAVQHLVVRYAKRGKMRFASHRDVARVFERGVRRAGLPIAYSAGFTPHPKISYAGGAPTGVASEAEYLALALTSRQAAAQVRERLNADFARWDRCDRRHRRSLRGPGGPGGPGKAPSLAGSRRRSGRWFCRAWSRRRLSGPSPVSSPSVRRQLSASRTRASGAWTPARPWSRWTCTGSADPEGGQRAAVTGYKIVPFFEWLFCIRLLLYGPMTC